MGLGLCRWPGTLSGPTQPSKWQVTNNQFTNQIEYKGFVFLCQTDRLPSINFLFSSNPSLQGCHGWGGNYASRPRDLTRPCSSACGQWCRWQGWRRKMSERRPWILLLLGSLLLPSMPSNPKSISAKMLVSWLLTSLLKQTKKLDSWKSFQVIWPAFWFYYINGVVCLGF